MNILGLSAFGHDSAAALLGDGEIIAAAQEERFTRRKHEAGFPAQAARYCLAQAGIGLHQVDAVAFHGDPWRAAEHERVACVPGWRPWRPTPPRVAPGPHAIEARLRGELGALDGRVGWHGRLLYCEHALGHAASAFFPSPFGAALIVTVDGGGDGVATSVAIGQGAALWPHKLMALPHSLGRLYSAFTSHLGFKVDSGEYKVMGLAPYGRARHVDAILSQRVRMRGDGSFALDLSTSDTLFDVPVRHPDGPLLQLHMDLAASIQAATEVLLLDMLQALRREFDLPRLCLAGDVALNCVANGRLLRTGLFEEIYVQPAAGDAGGALGAALAAWHGHFGRPREAGRGDRMRGACLGPSFEQADIERRLAALGAQYEVFDDATLLRTCAAELARGAALGWFQGRMEFGPRALGSRSILGDARSPTMQRTLNLKVKYRESFRPFAPSVLRERVADWFEFDGDSPYMLLVAGVHPLRRRELSSAEQAATGLDRLHVVRSEIPAVTHVDNSARLQTVDADTHPRYHALLCEFERLTGCPVLVNTSFNVRGEPIVCTPEDAFRCFMGTELDVLAIGNCLLRKARQDRRAAAGHRTPFEPD